jgi:hypothetical protein
MLNDQRKVSHRVVGQLREFAKLRDEGILTTEEFEAQKAKLLAR